MIPIKSVPSKEPPMEPEEIIAEAKRRQRHTQAINERIRYLEERIPLTCGISDKEKYLALLELINFEPRVIELLSAVQHEGIRMWVNYTEMMKEPIILDETGSIQIAIDATMLDICEYFRIFLL